MADLKRFLRDVRNHQMTIEIDQGEHRSIRFARPGSSAYHFRLVTWPGALSITGDCGSFTFCRTRDMFTFFRSPNGVISVNLSYWAEKLHSVSKSEGLHSFCEDRWKACVTETFNEWEFDDDDQKARAWAYLTDDWDGLLARDYSDLREPVHDAMNYNCPVTGQGFPEAWEWRLWDYGFHFRWCCHAIVWGIKRYDQHHAGRTQADHDRRVFSGVAA